MERAKKVPERMCVLCRKMQPKSLLVRIVFGSSGAEVDAGGKSGGRGAYVCASPECVKKCGNRKLLGKILKCECSEEFSERLSALLKEKEKEL